jgi:hypothetical protein
MNTPIASLVQEMAAIRQRDGWWPAIVPCLIGTLIAPRRAQRRQAANDAGGAGLASVPLFFVENQGQVDERSPSTSRAATGRDTSEAAPQPTSTCHRGSASLATASSGPLRAGELS